LHSYGFIQCCERALRIFFHYSQINEDPEDLNVGGIHKEFSVSVCFGVKLIYFSFLPSPVLMICKTQGKVII